MANIHHLVVVMLENRSFDQMVGWLYADRSNRPPLNLPRRSPPTYDGLTPDLSNPGTSGRPVRVKRGTSGRKPWSVPDPDPHELFRNMKFQMFRTRKPGPGQRPTMDGFVRDYATVRGNDRPDAIMQCFTPEQVPVISALARNYAICDRWFASVPCQTLPNRAFVHAGTSRGRVNNCDHNRDDCVPDLRRYDTPTIFNVLEDLGASWAVYNDSSLMSLTRVQFHARLAAPRLRGHFRSFGQFRRDARAGRLPAYSFIEPSFVFEPNDEHPPHDVRAGEAFLYEVWKAVSGGKSWNDTLLLVTFDEHGGCYDHVPPPDTAAKPDASKPQEPFDFRRYGVRVPAILVSPYIEPGTVFRSGSPEVEYDHTSILATLRDWLGLAHRDRGKMLASARIKAAPTLGAVLTLQKPRKGLPRIPPPPAALARRRFARIPANTPLSSIQKAVIAATAAQRRGAAPGDRAVQRELFDRVRTQGDAERLMRALR